MSHEPANTHVSNTEVSTHDNGGYEMEWHLPVAKCCGEVLGTERCDCPTCGIRVAPSIGTNIFLGTE